LLDRGQGSIPEVLYVAVVCERFGWTYQQYLEQPQFFLEAIAVKLETEGRIEKKRARDIERRKRA
jgi:hypothetical protein